MAPVTDAAGRDRAQIVLVGALTLAVSLVALAVVLNSAIYTENLASRSADAGVDAAVDVRESVRDGVGGLTDRANENHAGDDYAALSGTHLPTALADWRPMAVRHQAVGGRTFRVARVGNTEGTRIAQETVGEFTPYSSTGFAGGHSESNWLVASDVTVRQFALSQISAADLTSAGAPFDPESTGTFYVEIREVDGSDEWQVALYDAGGNVGVMVRDEDQESPVGSCVADSSATVDLTAGRLGGRACEPLSFLEDTDGPTDVYYVNGGAVRGAYELTVDRAGHRTDDPLKDRVDAVNYGLHCAGPTYADGPGAGSPYASAAVYSTTVDFRYDSQSVTYGTDVRAARGEPGSAPEHPRVTDFDVSDNSDSSSASFDVTWSSVDPDGDAVNVELTLTDLDDGDTLTRSLGADGSTTLTDSTGGAGVEGDGHTYDIRLRASDGTNVRATTETHQADGEGATGCPP